MPAWFPITLACAAAWAVADALCKGALASHPSRAVLGARWLYALPFLAVPLLWARLPAVDGVFWAVVAVCAPVEVFAMFLYLGAIGAAPLSLTAPLLAWTPVFTALAGAVALGESPGAEGAAGILLVVAGSWLLYSRGAPSPLAAFKALASEPAARRVLAVALIFSGTSALGKVGILHSSGPLFGAVYLAALALVLAAAAVVRGEGAALARELRPNWRFVAIGAAVAAMTFLHFTAVAMTQVSYMVAVKRSSLVFSVLLGAAFFKERDLRRRLPGALLMLAGVLLLGLRA